MMIASAQVTRRCSLLCVYVIAGAFAAGCGGKKPADDVAQKHAPRQDHEQIEKARQAILREEELGQASTPDETGPAPVLFVNGDAITVEQVLKWVRPRLREMKAELSPEEYHARMPDLLRAEVRAQAERTVISQQAEKDIGAQMTERLDQFVDGRIRDIVNSDHGGRESRYREWLEGRGITPEEDRERIRREMLVVAYLQRTVGPRVVEPTRQEIERYHADYLKSLRENAKRRMSLIDMPYGPTDATGREVSAPVAFNDALQRAARALERLHAGEDFADVAREYSEGINAYSGGDWGWVKKDGVKPRWQPAVDALYRLADGEVSDIVRTDAALFIVRCAGIEEVESPSFEELQPRLVESYKQQQFESLARELVAGLFAKADIRPANPGRFLQAVIDAAEQFETVAQDGPSPSEAGF